VNGIQVVLHDDAARNCVTVDTRTALNVVKHSGALQASINIEQVDGQVNIIVSDNGKGFDPTFMKAHSYGLKKIMTIIPGRCNLKIVSEPNKGTRITIEALQQIRRF